MQKIRVASLVDQGDRVLLYSADNEHYRVIASRKDNVHIGDEIEYETCGVNFGWFTRKLLTQKKLTREGLGATEKV